MMIFQKQQFQDLHFIMAWIRKCDFAFNPFPIPFCVVGLLFLSGSVWLGIISSLPNMHANLWNIRHSKERLGVLERTYAQKKHIESLITAKSAVDTHLTARHSLLSSKNSCRVGTVMEESSRAGHRESITRSNLSLSRSVDHLCLSRNLKTYSSLNRLLKKREIQDQNNKLLCRIITASPTLKRESWAKSQARNEKYKQNLNRRKHQQVDYSKEAIKLLRKSPRFMFARLAASTTRSFDRLNHIRL